MDPLLIVGGSFAALVVAVSAWLGARRIGLFGAERSVGSTDEDADAFGSIVRVVEPAGSDGTVRIWYSGTSWPARVIHGEAAVGTQVRIVDRDNLIWIVEPAGPALPRQ